MKLNPDYRNFNFSFPLLLFIIFGLGYIFLLFFLPLQIIDDAYITFTYSKHFANEGLPWYNLDPYDQGCGQTSLMWMCMIALCNLLGFGAQSSFLVLNIVMVLFLLFHFVQIVNNEKDSVYVGLFKIALIIFISSGLYLHSTHGLETILVFTVLYLFLKNWNSSKNYWSIILILVRPELILLSAAWMIDTSIFKFWKKGIFILIGLLLFGTFYAFYYDFPIPLAALYKYKTDFNWVGLKVFIGNEFLFLPIFFTLWKQKKWSLLAVIIFLIYYYTVHVGGYSNIYLRYILPLMTLYFTFPLPSELPPFKFKIPQWVYPSLLGLLMVRFIDVGFNFKDSYLNLIGENRTFHETYYEIARQSTQEDRILITDAGNIAYFSNAYCYDGLGLNDPTLLLAKLNNDWNSYFAYMKDRKMNTLLISSFPGDSLSPRFLHEKKVVEHFDLKNKDADIFPGQNFNIYVYKVSL